MPEQMLFSVEEWQETPKAVQEFVLSLVVRVQELESEMAVKGWRFPRRFRKSGISATTSISGRGWL
jgi:hypothetical protein